MTDKLRRVVEEDPEAFAEVMDDLSQSAERMHKLEALTDEQVADTLFEFVTQLSITSAQHDLLHNIVGRLRRAGRGPFRECSYCSKPGILARPSGQWVCTEHEQTR